MSKFEEVHMQDTDTRAQTRAFTTIDRLKIARSFGKAAIHYDDHADLQRQVADELLAFIPQFKPVMHGLDLGCGTGYCSKKMRQLFPDCRLLALDLALPMLQTTRALQINELALVCSDAQALPLANDLFDLVVSNLSMQWCANYAVFFSELLRITRSGSSVLLSTFGPQTLREVRAAWAKVDTQVHVNEFVPLHFLQQQAQELGFNCYSKVLSVQRGYPSLRALAAELKGLGAHNMNQQQSTRLTTRKNFAAAELAFEQAQSSNNVTAVTYEVFFLHLQKP